jgi:LemA protein
MVADLVAATVGERDELPARLRTARDAAGAAGRVAERIEAERAFVAALDAAFALARTYPALQANQEFARLRDERTSHDNRIAAAAEEYNEAVAAYNKAIAAFPARLVAELFGFEPEARFELHAEGAAS